MPQPLTIGELHRQLGLLLARADITGNEPVLVWDAHGNLADPTVELDSIDGPFPRPDAYHDDGQFHGVYTWGGPKKALLLE